ncbi:unnamed protein product [Durusdinium trenchii]|uniref:Uncharacterized protein n=1 Tax=Durusdinium trenchii TaxID=1381693 RepID=A0ABP0J2A1_9DINO
MIDMGHVDMFHREDIFRTRAFRSVPLCVELFDVSAAHGAAVWDGSGSHRFPLYCCPHRLQGIGGSCAEWDPPNRVRAWRPRSIVRQFSSLCGVHALGWMREMDLEAALYCCSCCQEASLEGRAQKASQSPGCVARPTGNFEDAGARPADVIDVPPRYGSRVLRPGPPGMRGVNLYKQTPGGPPRCVVGVGDPHIFSCVDAALRAIASLLAALLREYEDYFGPVGISTETADLRAAMLKAFDWKELLEVRQPRPDTCKLSTPFFGDLI